MNDMADVLVPRLAAPGFPGDPEAREKLKREGKYFPVTGINWAEDLRFPPRVAAWMAHSGNELLVFFSVQEHELLARVTEDQGPVYRDSCVELFISFGSEDYYNFEANPNGALLLYCGPDREHRRALPPAALASVRRWTGRDESSGEDGSGNGLSAAWELALAVPDVVFSFGDHGGFGGRRARANLYKCGDGLEEPHYLSWQTVDTPSPDFHRPEFFAGIAFSVI